MARDLLNRYIWLVDTIKRYGRITREELDECWLRSQYSNGSRLARRTFYNYRQAVEQLFNLVIECDPSTFEYYIASDDAHNESVTNWLLNSAAMNDMLSTSRDISHRIFLEEVPSARSHLGVIIDAVRVNHPIRFDYYSYTRSNPTTGVVLEPYFLKIFKQRWYVIGRHVAEKRIKTYALDRMKNVQAKADSQFAIPDDFDAEAYFRDSFGIVTGAGAVKKVVIRTNTRQAKYFRALPLHHSQQEMVHDEYSIFTYQMRVTDDFVEELLSHGPRVTVIEPPELRAMVKRELHEALANYDPRLQ